MFSSICQNQGRIAKQLVVQLAVIFYLTGCGASATGTDEATYTNTPKTSAPEVTLTADSTIINPNGDVLLGWKAFNVSSCTASDDWSGTKSANGQQMIKALKANSKFSITCTGENGSASDSVSVTVEDTPAVPIVQLSASPASITYGGSTTLNWSSANATSCSAAGGWTGAKSASGSLTINNLTSNTRYSLSCTGAGGTATEYVDVTVSAPVIAPTVNLSANPLSVVYNGSTELTWTAINADSCVASGNWSGDKSLSGTRTRNNLTADRTYTLTCTGPGGTGSDTVNINVAAPTPVLSFSASPSTVAQNGSTTLTWDSSDATSCTASGDWSGSKTASGSQLVSGLTVDSQFNLVCTGPGGSVNDTVIVTVNESPPALSFSASPSTVDQNGSTTLTWDSSDATSCTASGDWSGNKTASGSQLVSGLTVDSQFNLVCTGPGGSVSDTVNVAVVLNSTGTALISWVPPTSNQDNSALTDLTGYRIYYGTSPGNYSDPIALDNPGLTSYLIEGLANATWYFSITAVNSNGIESNKSQEVSKTIN